MTTAQVVETSVTVNNSPIHAGLRLPGRSYSACLWNNDNNNNNNYNYNYNHNYKKIPKSDWLSTALISALIGQLNRTVRVIPK